MIKKTLSITLKVVLLLLLLFVNFYLFCIVPNDSRTRVDGISTVADEHEELTWDGTALLKKAKITRPADDQWQASLAAYPSREDDPSLHAGAGNMHVSLGYFPFKTVHRDCVVAPAPSDIEYTLTLPGNPVMKFDYGLLPRSADRNSGPVNFAVTVTERGKTVPVFQTAEQPMKPYPYRAYQGIYKNFLKYLHPKLEDRDARWNAASIDLKPFAGKKITLTLSTRPASDKQQGVTLAFWGQPRIFDRSAGKPSRQTGVILVVMDSMRADELDEHVTPNLWELAGSGINCREALTNGNMTKLSVYSFLTSRYPADMPEVAMHYEVSKEDRGKFYQRKLATLPDAFKKAGYRTAAIGSASLFSDGHGFSADLGFDEVVNLEHSGYSPTHVTRTAIDWLNRHGNEKFFLMVYYDGPHGPYRPPLRYLWQMLGQRRDGESFRRLLYRAEVRYHDEYIGVLRKFLDASKIADKSILAFTSDHGVAFRTVTYDWPTKFGSWKKKKVAFHSHGVSVTPEDLRVPLFFLAGRKPAVVEDTAQLLDLAPTLLDLAGVPVPAGFKGSSLVPAFNGKRVAEPVTFHQGWQCYGLYVNNEYLYIRNTAPREKFPAETLVPEELYRVSDDGECSDNRVCREPRRTALMRRLARTYVPGEVELRLKLAGPGNAAGTVTVESTGKLDVVKGNPLPGKRPGRRISFALQAADEVVLKTSPSADITLSGTLNGKPLTKDHILAGELALPLLNGRTFSLANDEAVFGWPPSGLALDVSGLIVGARHSESIVTENLSTSPKQLKSMLEEWGYIN